MDTITFETPSGHKLTIKPTLNHPEKRRVQRVLMSSGKLDPQTGEPSVDFGVQIDAQDTLLKIMVRRIQFADGRIVEGNESLVFTALSDMSDEDVTAIYDKVDELTAALTIFPNPEREKKASA